MKTMSDRCIELLRIEYEFCRQDPSVIALSELSKFVLNFIGLGHWTVLYSPSLDRDFCYSRFALLSIQPFTVRSLLELLQLCIVSVHIIRSQLSLFVVCCFHFNFVLVFVHSNYYTDIP
jgi:hypothetical protein